jgi:serine/threonine kinase 33
VDDPFQIRVADFGLATFVDKCTMMENLVGTPLYASWFTNSRYMAPEVLNASLGYSSQCDIWSIGIIMYLLMCNYEKHVDVELSEMITRGKVEFPAKHWQNLSEGGRRLVESMLEFNPAKRISALEILVDPWIMVSLRDSNIQGQKL